VGTDPQDDVAVLKLTGASDLQTIPLGDSDTVKVGDQVAAIGNAGGTGGTPSIATGRVTALGQQITASDEDGSNAETLTDMIQVDANVIPGDSGGPLANTNGEVIGMDSAAAAGAGSVGSTRVRGGSGGGEGYAIPINKALSIAEELKRTGANGGSSSGTSTSGGYLGVQVQVSADGGAGIVSVQSGSPAAEAGLTAGTTIVALGRTEIPTPDALVSALSKQKAGDQVTITWLGTDGRSHQTSVTLAGR
jgi:S1-C subfamily serine protease